MVNTVARGNRGRRLPGAGEQGFTLVEMLVVITIIGMIMALVGPRVLNYLSESKAKAAKIQIESFSSALDLYYLDLGRYPTSNEGLAALTRNTSQAGWNGPYLRGGGARGFALIEILCVLAIIGLLAAIILPAVPRTTTRAKLESYAVEIAALLKADRNAALRREVRVATQVDAEARAIRSGVTGRTIRLPGDVIVQATLASRCADRAAGRSIDFFPSGMSCGGTIALARPGMGYEVRVNWLTGGVEIVTKKLL